MRHPALALALAVVFSTAQAQPDGANEQPAQAQLQRLKVLGSVLMIGAHDDDDDTLLLTYLSLGLHLRTGYLSLARGTGAQNRIGAEQADAMGVLLTQEAIAARRIVNVEQYYTRVFDFGFSKTLRESMDRWERPEVLSDIVWVLRTFRPDIVIIRYSGTPRDGHGNHQASAVLARKAIPAAADPSQFTGQLKYTTTWTPKRIFQYGGSGATSIALEVGGKSPLLDRPFSELAAASRRSFRSQAMGGTIYPYSRRVLLTPLDDNRQSDFLGGIDITWQRLKGGAAIGDTVAALSGNQSKEQPEPLLPRLLELRDQITELATTASDPWVGLKLTDLDELIAQCAGVTVRATAASEIATPGSTVNIVTSAVSRRPNRLELTKITLRSRTGETDLLVAPAILSHDQPASHSGTWRVPGATEPSQPYWLGDREGLVAIVADQTLISPAEDPPVLQARFQFRLGTHGFELTRAVKSELDSPGSAKRIVPLVIAPDVTLHPSHAARIFPNGAARQLSVSVTSHRENAAGAVMLDLSADWKCEPREHRFEFTAANQSAAFTFTVTPPSSAAEVTIFARAGVSGRTISVDRTVVDYPHIERRILFPKASIRLVSMPVTVAAKRVGYVMGTGDEMPSCLEQLGCAITHLTAQDLAERDLAIFDAIVLGIRAYNVRPDVLLNQERLRHYVRAGGTLLMQYTVSQQGPNAPVEVPHLGPYPFRLSAARVTVEDSAVTFSPANHPLLSAPNAISAADFAGWIQERGLHFASQWDPRYETPLECHDPDEPPLPGGLLYSRYGDGVFIYTGHSWFRQLPAGVPGAYRIFANLLSSGRETK